MRISLFAWEIIFLVVASVGILSFIILKVCHFTKNRYYHSFVENELIDSKNKVNSKNDVYFTDNLTYRYIDKYVICKTSTDLFLICNFCKNYKKIKFFVIQYNKKKKVIGIKRITELSTKLISRVVALNKRTKYVNIVVGKVDDVEINQDVIRPLTKKAISLNCLFVFLLTLSVTYSINFLFAYLFAGNFLLPYLNGFVNLIVMLSILSFSILTSLFSFIGLKRKNKSLIEGGVLEYEFF